MLQLKTAKRKVKIVYEMDKRKTVIGKMHMSLLMVLEQDGESLTD